MPLGSQSTVFTSSSCPCIPKTNRTHFSIWRCWWPAFPDVLHCYERMHPGAGLGWSVLRFNAPGRLAVARFFRPIRSAEKYTCQTIIRDVTTPWHRTQAGGTAQDLIPPCASTRSHRIVLDGLVSGASDEGVLVTPRNVEHRALVALLPLVLHLPAGRFPHHATPVLRPARHILAL